MIQSIRNARLAVAPLLVLAATHLSSVAQSTSQVPPPTGDYTFHVTSRLVLLDVVVTDRLGNVRNDLKPEDFHITEDGVPQTIRNFELPSSHIIPPTSAPITSTADLEKKAPQAPVNIIVLDELNTTFQDMAYARYALKKYLKAQFQHAQAPTMLIAVNFDKVTVLHDYTQDGNTILSALNHHLTAYPWNLQRGEDKIRTLALSLGVLEQVTQATAGHTGHKNLIWVGKGFPGIDLTSPNISNDAASGIISAMHQAVNMLRDSRVTLYTIDPTILSSVMAVTTDADSLKEMDDVPGAATPDPFGSEASFTNLAIKSGGKAFYSRNDIDREVGESVRDGVNYYTISYRPTNGSDVDRPYRKIHIALSTSGLHAAYRDGYYSKPTAAPTASGTRMTYDMDAAEESTLVYTGLSVAAIHKPDTSDTYLVGVPQSELNWSRDGDQESAKLLLIVAALDGKNRTLARDTLEASAHRPINASTPSSGYARFEIKFATPHSAIRLRFVVRGLADGRMGTADIVVPSAPAVPPLAR